MSDLLRRGVVLASVAALVSMLVVALSVGVTGAAGAQPVPIGEPSTGDPTGAPTETPTQEPSAPATPSTTGSPDVAVTLDDAVLRWGLNDESNNRAFAPNTFNFFSAGLLPDPGRGGVMIRQEQWQQSSAGVRVEKWNGTSWNPATWAGLGTGPTGVPLGAPTAGTFSDHTFVFTGGTGTVDVAEGSANIAWTGDLTVLYYSGMSFFHLSDPVLDVRDGAGTLTATLRGYRSSQTDQAVWEAVAPRPVTLATLPTVDLSDSRGFTALPAYAGVRVSGVPQSTDGPSAGSFPQSFVDYLGELGSAAFWYSSGASTDPFKVALPLTVSFDAANPVSPPAPSTQTSQAPKPSISNPAIRPPRAPTPTPTSTPASVPMGQARAPVDAVASESMPPPGSDPLGVIAAAPVSTLIRPATSMRLTAGSPVGVVATAAWGWWLGGALLIATALTLLVPTGRSGPGAPRSRTTQS